MQDKVEKGGMLNDVIVAANATAASLWGFTDFQAKSIAIQQQIIILLHQNSIVVNKGVVSFRNKLI